MHGEIKVNGVTFGVWSAARDIGTNDQPTYECAFEWLDEEGYFNEAFWKMEHCAEKDGPLAARVVTEGYKLMERRRYGK